jgi:hypothetical protein
MSTKAAETKTCECALYKYAVVIKELMQRAYVNPLEVDEYISQLQRSLPNSMNTLLMPDIGRIHT